MPRCPRCGTNAPAYILQCAICGRDFVSSDEAAPEQSADAAPEQSADAAPEQSADTAPEQSVDAGLIIDLAARPDRQAPPPPPAALEEAIASPASPQRHEITRLIVVAGVGALLAVAVANFLMRRFAANG